MAFGFLNKLVHPNKRNSGLQSALGFVNLFQSGRGLPRYPSAKSKTILQNALCKTYLVILLAGAEKKKSKG